MRITNAQNRTGLSTKLLNELLWAAEHRYNDLRITGTQARALLEELNIEWIPECGKGDNLKESLQNFKAVVRAKYGAKNVRFSMGEQLVDGKYHDYLVVSVSYQVFESDAVMDAMLEASGLSRYFEEWGSGTGRGFRDVNFGSKKGRNRPRE